MNDDNELNFEFLPCPFCGSKEVEPLFMRWEEQWRVICNSCGAYTTFGYADVSRWNARPIEDALLARAEAAERELAALRERKQGVCRWRLEDDDSSLWAGDCGAMWTFPGGNPEENDMAYCPKCGRKLEQVEPDPPEDA